MDSPVNAAAVSVALLVIAFVVSFVLRVFGSRASKREEQNR